MQIAVWALILAAQGQPPAFEDISTTALEAREVHAGSADQRWIVEVNGGGLGLEDWNGDGTLDLLVVDGSTWERLRQGKLGFPPRLLLGVGNGRFKPAGKDWAMEPVPWGSGLAAGDFDGDGWCDLAVGSLGAIHLYRNLAGQGFQRVQTPGIDGAGWNTSLCFFDADANGTLDLFVVRYLHFDPETAPGLGERGARWKGQPVLFGPEGFEAQSDRLYLGAGDGTFREVSKERGFEKVAPAFGLGVVARDVDGDGDTDLYVSGDSTPNHLWRNEGAGMFSEQGFAMGLSHGSDGREQAGMGIACAPLGDTRTPSFFVTNFSGENNALYQPSRKPGRFRERSSRAGLANPSLALLGWGTGFFDWDLDGVYDLWVLNGHVYPQADAPGSDTSYAQPDQLFVRNPEGRFVPRPLHAGPDRVSRTGVAGDLDGDGDEDLVIWTMEGELQVLRNTHRSPHAWIGLDVRGPVRNSLGTEQGQGRSGAAIGAQVCVEIPEQSSRPAIRQYAEIQRSAGFQASRPARRVFGLGGHEGTVSVRVRWPAPLTGETVHTLKPGTWHVLHAPPRHTPPKEEPR